MGNWFVPVCTGSVFIWIVKDYIAGRDFYNYDPVYVEPFFMVQCPGIERQITDAGFGNFRFHITPRWFVLNVPEVRVCYCGLDIGCQATEIVRVFLVPLEFFGRDSSTQAFYAVTHPGLRG